jgi:hypothetical protein
MEGVIWALHVGRLSQMGVTFLWVVVCCWGADGTLLSVCSEVQKGQLLDGGACACAAQVVAGCLQGVAQTGLGTTAVSPAHCVDVCG